MGGDGAHGPGVSRWREHHGAMGDRVNTLLGIAANPSAPPEVLVRLEGLPGALAVIAGRADLDPDHAWRLHSDADVHTA